MRSAWEIIIHFFEIEEPFLLNLRFRSMIKSIFSVLILLIVLSSCKPGEKAAIDSTVQAKELSGPDQSAYSLIYINASKEKMLGNYEKAGYLFKEAIKKDPTNPAAYYELAHISYYLGNLEEALGLAKKATELNKENSWYTVLYLGLLEETGNYEEVANQLERLRKLNPDRTDYTLDYADALEKSGKHREAIKVYDELEQVIGVSEEISRKKQMIYLQMNDIEGAVGEIESLIKEYPGEPRYLAMLADIYRSNDEPDEAFTIYGRILESDPENPFALLSLADYYKVNSQPKKSFSFLKRAYKNPALDIDTKVKILLSYYVLSEEDTTLKTDAYELADILQEVHPDEAKSFAVYGDFLYRDSRWAEAREKFKVAVDLDPSRLPVWTQLMLLENQLGEYEALYESASKAVELFPANPAVYYFRGIAAMRLSNYDQAVEDLETAGAMVIDDPGLSAQIYSSLGDAYHSLNEHDKSDKAYEKSLSFDPNNPYVLNNYSYYLSQRSKNLERAASMAKRANELESGVSSFEDTYGWVLYMQGKYDEAEKWIKKALESDNERSQVILEHYGDVLSKLGKSEEAKIYWNKALEKSPDNEKLKNKINNGATGP